MRKVASRAFAVAFVLTLAIEAGAGIVSPRNGGPYPPHYRELKERSKDAFTFKHAWLARRANQVRGDGRYRLALSPAGTAIQNASRALGGKLAVPVVLGLYTDISTPPATRNAYDQEFFTGPWTPGTMRQYWQEVSYNLFDVTGTVFDWVPLSQSEVYYTGGVARGLTPGVSRTGDMIKEILDALDPSVDFGAFDNDGPDGVPNSGDDDGFVDVLLVLHPTYGAECDYSLHMWSHSWNYSSWPVSGGLPYGTNDAAAGGGFIRMDDYIIAPSASCEFGQIEIGVICHELGHAIGLPDLYDYNGNSSGIGYWGLMGAGNWNTPASPAHLCGWSREQLGWLNPVEVDWRARKLTLDPVGASGDAVKIPLPTRRFKRTSYGTNSYALICSYGDLESAARQWPGGAGYGNGWNESIFREFSVDASRPVSLHYDASIDVEADYDFGRLLLEVGGAVETLAVYTGSMSRREVLDLGSHLPAGGCTFTLRYEFTSDISYSDEDDYFDSDARYTYNIDNVHLSGGGLDYIADFELDSGGWRWGSAPAEYFLVENRRKTGFDASLAGQGMLLWHAENSIAFTILGNSGGTSNTQARGLVLEEADARYDLITSAGNYGDAGDPYPGSANNRSFGPTTVPRNQSNGGFLTPVAITGIAQSGSALSATFRGGMPAPSIAAVLPDTIDKESDLQAILDIRGSWMLHGANSYLSLERDTVPANGVEWLGEERVIATFPIELLHAGEWDLTVLSGDGQATTVQGAVGVRSLVLRARVVPGRDYFLAEWVLKDVSGIRGCLLFRAMNEGAFERITPDTLRGPSLEFAFRDFSVEPDNRYSYKIVAYLNGGGEELYVIAGPFTLERFPFIADQNYPNPFNGATTISFFMPAAQPVAIDIYDVSGAIVAHFAEKKYERGTQTLRWAPAENGVSAGVYFCVFRTGGATKTVKMVYVP